MPQHHSPRATRLFAAIAGGAAAAGLLVSAPADAAPAPEEVRESAVEATTAGSPSPVPGIPAAAPEAAFATEPELPHATDWPFSDAFPRTSGTSRYDDGALLWSDWLYDDTGSGRLGYADEDAASNGADVFRAGVGVERNRSYWRVDWTTLIDPELPIAVWSLDTDDDPATGASAWPAGAGVTSPGADAFLIMSARGVWLVDGATGARTDLTGEGATLAVDSASRSFVASVPRSALRVNGTWRIRLASGIADETGDGFAAPPESPDMRVYNTAFRAHEQEIGIAELDTMATRWNNTAQSEALADRDMTDFSLTVDWRRLVRGDTEAEPAPTGFSTRWYVSSAELGQGLHPEAREPQGQPPTADPRIYGRVQPYTVYVPTDYDPAQPAPLTILLHGGGNNHNGFRGAERDALHQPLCEERGSICVAPLGRGDGTWYVNEAELDVWEVWNRLAGAYSLDADRTVIAGWSMGGVGTTRLAANYPDVFAGAGIVSGAGYRAITGERDRDDDHLRVENLANMRVFMDAGTADIAEQNTRDWDAALLDAEVPSRVHYYGGAEHGDFGVVGWPELASHLGDSELNDAPARIAFRWDPGEGREDLGLSIDSAYWLTDLEPRDPQGRWSRAEAVSGALDTVVREPELWRDTARIDGREVEMRELSLVPSGTRPATEDLRVELSNIARASVDLDRAGLDPATAVLQVTADGPVKLTVNGGDESRTLELPAGEHEIHPGGN